MKALAYERAHPLGAFAIELVEVAEPVVRDSDALVEVRAIGVNPGEASIRSSRSAEPCGRVILGWEFAGVVIGTGSLATGFAVGDRVFGTGDIMRDGCWAQRLAVDHRVIATIPDELSFTDAASLPIGTLTAWEAIFRDRAALPPSVDMVLIIGGAGGVGSLATQLLKARTSAFVISTASRPESSDWCRSMGADLVIDHTTHLGDQLRQVGIAHVDMVLSTAATADNLTQIAALLRPFGHVSTTDIGPPLDLAPLVVKSVSLHTETVFSQLANGADPSSQGDILRTVSGYAGSRQVRPILTTLLTGLTADTMKTAHSLLESHRTIGKIVIEPDGPGGTCVSARVHTAASKGVLRVPSVSPPVRGALRRRLHASKGDKQVRPTNVGPRGGAAIGDRRAAAKGSSRRSSIERRGCLGSR